MPEFTQLPLPGMPRRIILSVAWMDPSTPCRIGALIDHPTAEYNEGTLLWSEVHGRMTPEELITVACTLLADVLERATADDPSSVCAPTLERSSEVV